MKKTNKNKKPLDNQQMFILGAGCFLAFCIIMLLTGCSASQTIEIKVPTPCIVEQVPNEPAEINLNSATIADKMDYVKNIVQYAKEVRPIIKECVREGKIESGVK